MNTPAGMSGKQQTIVIIAIVLAIMLVALMPIWVAGALGKILQDSLVSMSDKAVVGLIGVLGTVTGLSFRSSPSDAQRVDNTGKALDAIAAAQAAPAPSQSAAGAATAAAGDVADAAAKKADEIAANQPEPKEGEQP